jgi:hypothetical protein
MMLRKPKQLLQRLAVHEASFLNADLLSWANSIDREKSYLVILQSFTIILFRKEYADLLRNYFVR